MIVLMMAMVSKVDLKISRLLNLLIGLFCISCESKSNTNSCAEKLIVKSSIGKVSADNDSLEIVINNIPSKIFAGINLINSNLEDTNLEFYNGKNTPSSISRKIHISNSKSTLLSFRGFSLINNIHKSYWHMFIVSQPTSKIEFEYKQGDVILTSCKNVISVETIRKAYSEIDMQLNTKKITASNCILKLEELHNKYDILFKEKDDFSSVKYNDLEFINSLSKADPKDKRINDYLITLKGPLYSQALKSIIYNYVNVNSDVIGEIDYINKNLSSEFKRLLSIEVYLNLIRYKTKKYASYKKNLNWLKMTDFYKENIDKIDLALIVKDQSLIVNGLKSFDVCDYSGNETNLEKITKENKSDYYLIDFWASWCLPCIKDSKIIHEMSLPKNLKIINISLDKTRDKEKWLGRSTELNLNYSYLLIENENNKKFITKINLNQIPRYILIDQDFNILDIDMLSPSESSFKEELNNYLYN